MMDGSFFRFISALLTLVGLVGCGGDDPAAGPGAIEGPYAMILGSQQEVYSLKPGDAQITCRPKPGLSEFEFKAENLGAGGNTIEFNLQDFDPKRKSWSIEYAVGKPVQNKFSITFAGGYRYVFFQALNAITNKTFTSRCNIDLDATDSGTQTHYLGLMNCTMLWSDFGTTDYNPGPLNNYIDLIIKFECDY